MAYSAAQDGYLSWQLAIHWKAITTGLKRPSRPLELSWTEAAGGIP